MTTNFKQDITAVFGQPVAENPTQPMMEAGYRHHGLAWRYLTLEVAPADLGDAMQGMRAMGFRGVNCTIPHKVAVIAHLDRLTDAAERIGAVNCIKREGHELVGENTDGKGFLASLRGVSDPTGKRIVLLGAGGAARAIGVELALAGAAQVTVVNRSAERGSTLAEVIAACGAESEYVAWDGDYRVPEETDVLINCTPIGLFPDVNAEVPLDTATIRETMIVCDVVPNPPETRLVQVARERGCTVLDGLGMLVNQGVIGFRWWTGVDPDADVMRRALEDALGLSPT